MRRAGAMEHGTRSGGGRAVRAALFAAALAALLGCGSSAKTVVIHDPSAVNLAEARSLAAEAQREQQAGHTDRAIELYKKSLDASKELGFVWNNLGLLYMQKDDYIDAVDMFQSAADLMPQSPKPYYNIGLAYSRRGYDTRALEFFSKALDCNPRDVDSLRGAVMSAKRLDLSDDNSLMRVRRALMVETDPRWKRMQESEQIRIETAMTRAKENAPMALPAGLPVFSEPVPDLTPQPAPEAPGQGKADQPEQPKQPEQPPATPPQ
jgi:tetratricopeptide (TPR) repeat protein